MPLIEGENKKTKPLEKKSAATARPRYGATGQLQRRASRRNATDRPTDRVHAYYIRYTCDVYGGLKRLPRGR